MSSSLNRYSIGDMVTLTLNVVAAGAPIDPDTVTVRVKAPNAAEVDYIYGSGPDVVKDETGQYHIEIPVTVAGYWYYKWETTGTGQGANGGSFIVEADAF